MQINGSVVVVTGAASGMGRLTSRKMAEQGALVASFDVNEAGLAETAENYPNIHTQKVDVTDFRSVKSALDHVEQSLGPVARVYHGAAIMPIELLLEQDNALVHRIMAINYGGLVNIAQAALPPMIQRGKGDFISFSSIAGWVPMLRMGAYNASKFAVTAFTEVLYHENRGSGVRFACVCPPPIATPMMQKAHEAGGMPQSLEAAKVVQPEEVLDAIEEALAQNQFWVFPGKGTRTSQRFRRFLPNVVWKNVHSLEGF